MTRSSGVLSPENYHGTCVCDCMNASMPLSDERYWKTVRPAADLSESKVEMRSGVMTVGLERGC